jgi:hypothetical protein
MRSTSHRFIFTVLYRVVRRNLAADAVRKILMETANRQRHEIWCNAADSV